MGSTGPRVHVLDLGDHPLPGRDHLDGGDFYYMYVTTGAMWPVEDGRPVDVFTPASPPANRMYGTSLSPPVKVGVACGCDVAVAVAARVRVAVAVCSSVTAV